MPIFPRQPRLSFFDMMHDRPDWSTAKILDIGGNRGNLCADGRELQKFPLSNYTCLEVDNEAIEFGKEKYPTANWIHHKAFNNVYQTEGNIEEPFPFADSTFDIICAYSVYSHTTFKQFIYDLFEALRVCKPGGSIAFTLVDMVSAEWFVDKRKMDYEGSNKLTLSYEKLCEKEIEDFIYFINNDLLIDEINNVSSFDYLVTVYNLKWVSSFLDKLNITHKIKFPPQQHIQRTLVIKRGDEDVGALKQLYETNKNLVDILF